MPGTLPSNYLDPLNFGTSTGGAAGLAETTTTLGQDPVDQRVPPDQFHLSNLQIARIKNLVLNMSAFSKGGTMMQVLTQSSNPASIGQNVFWSDGASAKFTNAAGTITTLGAGGAGSTLAVGYTAGSSSADSTLSLTSTLGPLALKDNATPIGTLFNITSNGGTTIFNVNATAATLTNAAASNSFTTPTPGLVLVNTLNASGGTTATQSPALVFSNSNYNGVQQQALDWAITASDVGGGVAQQYLVFSTRLTAAAAAGQGTGAFLNKFGMSSSAAINNFFLVQDSGVTAQTLLGVWDTAEGGSTALHGYVGTATNNDFVIRSNNTARFIFLAGGGLRAAGATATNISTTIATGSSRAGIILNDVNAATATDKVLDIQIGGTSRLSFRQDRFLGNLTASCGFYLLDAGTTQFWNGGIDVWDMGTATYQPHSDFGSALGGSANRITQVWARQFCGVENTIANAASITIDPALGEYVRILLGATGITSIALGTFQPGETVRIAVIQDATGSRTITGWPASVVFVAGSPPTFTTTANKRDLLSGHWDATASKLYVTVLGQNL